MITLSEYFGPYLYHAEVTDTVKAVATDLLAHVSRLESWAIADRVGFVINPRTGSPVAGTGNGGYRIKSCLIGAAGSAHKEARAVDLYDPGEQIDTWCMRNLDKLREVGIYIEHPETTPGWSHWTIRPPPSKRIVFWP